MSSLPPVPHPLFLSLAELSREVVAVAREGRLVFVNAAGGRMAQPGMPVEALAGLELARVPVGDAELVVGRQAEAEHLLTREQFHQSQKMEAVAQLAAGIAHDFGNIIGAMIACADAALSKLPAGSEAADDLANIYSAGMRASRIAEQLLSFTRPDVGQVRALRLDEVVVEACALLRASLPRRIVFEVGVSRCLALADDTALYQVVTNLCVNAGHAIGERDGRITVIAGPATPACPAVEEVAPARLRLGTPPAGRPAMLQVRDTGCGMGPELLSRIFEPFFSTRAKGQGSGLGLAAVHGIVTGLGGALMVDSVEGKGSCFTILLPSPAES